MDQPTRARPRIFLLSDRESDETRFNEWSLGLENNRRAIQLAETTGTLVPGWRSLPIELCSNGKQADFLAGWRGMFNQWLVTDPARNAIRECVAGSVEFLPVHIAEVWPEAPASMRRGYPRLWWMRVLDQILLTKNAKATRTQGLLFVDRYAFVIDDLRGRHILQVPGGEVLISHTLRSIIRKKKLKGASLIEVKYVAGKQRQPLPKRKVPKPIPAVQPPSAMVLAHVGDLAEMSDALWHSWVEHWNWSLAALKRRLVDDVTRISIAKPLGKRGVQTLEMKLNWALPRDFADILARYSGGVRWGWIFEDGGKMPQKFESFTVGDGCLWNYKILAKLSRMSRKAAKSGWLAFRDSLPSRLPFYEVGNGDVLAFDMRKSQSTCPVVYLSHENDPARHEKRLASSFIDYISRVTNLACISPEYLLNSPFYDSTKRQLRDSGALVDQWRSWLTGDEP